MNVFYRSRKPTFFLLFRRLIIYRVTEREGHHKQFWRWPLANLDSVDHTDWKL